MKINQLIILVVLITVIAGGSFYGGMKYQTTKTLIWEANGQFARLPNSTIQQRRQGQNGTSMVRGEVQSIENGTMTIKLDDGSSKLVLISNTTIINKSETGSMIDLKKGENLLIFGATNLEGIITPVSIQIGNFTRPEITPLTK